ncbi:MAG: hypothetical protein KJZ79_04600, partial [Bryobacteraceae bacterium]|nr:hypothetical protein [Bryobacteraceae bacterium]
RPPFPGLSCTNSTGLPIRHLINNPTANRNGSNTNNPAADTTMSNSLFGTAVRIQLRNPAH